MNVKITRSSKKLPGVAPVAYNCWKNMHRSFNDISCVCVAVLPQASLQKSLDSQKNSLDLKKITRFNFFASKFAVLLEMI